MQELKIKAALKTEIDSYGKADEIIKLETKTKNSSKKIIEAFTHTLPDDSLHMEGKEFELLITARSEKTITTSNEKILEHLGMEKFLKLAHFSIEDLRQWLNPEQFNAVTTTVKGSRTFRAKRKQKDSKAKTPPLTLVA
jgi:hypothetical protein